MDWTLLRQIFALRWRGFLHLRRASAPARLVCLQERCPTPCCRYLGPPQLERFEVARFGDRVVETPGLATLAAGSCGGCGELRKDGKCGVYLRRPKACVDYPWYNVDGVLYVDRGCPGIIFDQDERPDPALIRPFERYLITLPPLLRTAVQRWVRF